MAKSVPNAYFGRGGVTKTVILEARRRARGGWQPAPRMWRPKIRVLLLLGRFRPLVPTVWRMVSALP